MSNSPVTVFILNLLISVLLVGAGNDVALIVERHRRGLAALVRLTTPDALIILGQLGHIGEAGVLNATLGLILGEAIRTRTGAEGFVVSVVATAGVVEVVAADLSPIFGSDFFDHLLMHLECRDCLLGEGL